MASPALDPVFLASRIDSLERQVADTTSKTLLLSLAHARAEARAKESDERLRQLVTLMRTVIPSTRPPPQLLFDDVGVIAPVQRMLAAGIALTATGVVGLVFSFDYISATLAVATGALVVDTFRRGTAFAVRQCDPVNGKKETCGSPEHIPNLAIATMAFGAAGFFWTFFPAVLIAIDATSRPQDGGARVVSSWFFIGALADTAAVLLAAFILVMMRAWTAALRAETVRTALMEDGGEAGAPSSSAGATTTRGSVNTGTASAGAHVTTAGMPPAQQHSGWGIGDPVTVVEGFAVSDSDAGLAQAVSLLNKGRMPA